MNHFWGIADSILIGLMVGIAVHLLTSNWPVAIIIGDVAFFFSLGLFSRLVYIRDEIRGKK